MGTADMIITFTALLKMESPQTETVHFTVVTSQNIGSADVTTHLLHWKRNPLVSKLTHHRKRNSQALRFILLTENGILQHQNSSSSQKTESLDVKTHPLASSDVNHSLPSQKIESSDNTTHSITENVILRHKNSPHNRKRDSLIYPITENGIF